MEDAMTNYLPAIDIMMCHLGISFEQACEQLGLSQQEQQARERRLVSQGDEVAMSHGVPPHGHGRREGDIVARHARHDTRRCSRRRYSQLR